MIWFRKIINGVPFEFRIRDTRLTELGGIEIHGVVTGPSLPEDGQPFFGRYVPMLAGEPFILFSEPLSLAGRTVCGVIPKDEARRSC